jgi:hypothetical protein
VTEDHRRAGQQRELAMIHVRLAATNAAVLDCHQAFFGAYDRLGYIADFD